MAIEARDTQRMQPETTTAGGEFPSTNQLSGIGELCFLFFRSDTADRRSVAWLRRCVEPAVDTGHLIILRQDGVPRAALTYAYLTEEAEARVLRGEALSSQDWIAGDRLWLMDLIAPYGQGSAGRMIRFWHDSLEPDVTEYQYVRAGKREGELRHGAARRMPNGRFGTKIKSHMPTQ